MAKISYFPAIENQNTMKITFIGLGIMGRGMARNLLKAGFAVRAWNRTVSRVDDLVAEGASAGSSPADVAALLESKATIDKRPEGVDAIYALIDDLAIKHKIVNHPDPEVAARLAAEAFRPAATPEQARAVLGLLGRR